MNCNNKGKRHSIVGRIVFLAVIPLLPKAWGLGRWLGRGSHSGSHRRMDALDFVLHRLNKKEDGVHFIHVQKKEIP
jgi:hypothetical protein